MEKVANIKTQINKSNKYVNSWIKKSAHFAASRETYAEQRNLVKKGKEEAEARQATCTTVPKFREPVIGDYLSITSGVWDGRVGSILAIKETNLGKFYQVSLTSNRAWGEPPQESQEPWISAKNCRIRPQMEYNIPDPSYWGTVNLDYIISSMGSPYIRKPKVEPTEELVFHPAKEEDNYPKALFGDPFPEDDGGGEDVEIFNEDDD
jgi:hypothetical protein